MGDLFIHCKASTNRPLSCSKCPHQHPTSLCWLPMMCFPILSFSGGHSCKSQLQSLNWGHLQLQHAWRSQTSTVLLVTQLQLTVAAQSNRRSCAVVIAKLLLQLPRLQTTQMQMSTRVLHCHYTEHHCTQLPVPTGHRRQLRALRLSQWHGHGMQSTSRSPEPGHATGAWTSSWPDPLAFLLLS